MYLRMHIRRTPVEVILICQCLLGLLVGFTQAKDHQGDFCVDKPFSAACDANEVIVMKKAVYGRMDMSHCVTVDFGYIGCHTDVLKEMDKLCSGQHHCEFPITTTLIVPNPCLDLTRFLRVTYSCVPVASSSKQCSNGHETELSSSSGYLSSIVTKETRCGSVTSPWIIEVDPSQTVNFTLLDFSGRGKDPQGVGATCVTYATVHEIGTGKEYVICRSTQRENHAYTSQGHKLKVSLKLSAKNEAQFLLKYQVNGCKTPKYPSYVKVTRQGRHLKVLCLITNKQWTLQCRHNAWHGKTPNCTLGRSFYQGTPYIGGLFSRFSNEVAIATIVTIAFILCSCIIVGGIIIVKRRNQMQEEAEAVARYGSADDLDGPGEQENAVPSVSKSVNRTGSPSRRPLPVRGNSYYD